MIKFAGGGVPFRFQWGNFWQFIYKKELIDKHDILFYPVKYNEDIPFAQRAFFVAERVVSKNEQYYIQWSNANSVMQNQKAIEFLDAHIKSYRYSEEWYVRYSQSFYYYNSVLSIISQILPLLCCTYSFKEVKKLFDEDDRFYIKEGYEKECLTEEIIK